MALTDEVHGGEGVAMTLRTIGKYEILRELGRGGFAIVYEARDTKRDRTVALKILHPHWASDPTFAARFHAEAEAVIQLRPPHIVNVYETVEDGSYLGFAMEYLPGRTLQEILEAQAQLPTERTLAILEQVAVALDYAHEAGLVHRDIKPSNILVDEYEDRDDIKLVDFGLVRVLDSSDVYTKSGDVLGTPEYMAPEQADATRKDEIGPATDRYALGILAYQMLTGKLPFSGNTTAVMHAQINTPPPALSGPDNDFAPQVDAVFARILSKTPGDRYATAQDFVDALATALFPVPAPPTRIPWGWIAAVSALSVVILALLWCQFGGWPCQTPPPSPTGTATPSPTLTATPDSGSPTPTLTLTPPSTSHPTPTSLPTLAHPVLRGTPLPFAVAALSPDNADRVQYAGRWGKGVISDLAYSPDGAWLAATTSVGIYLYDMKSLELVHFLETGGWVRSVAFAPDGTILASGSDTRKIDLWRVPEGTHIKALEGHRDWVRSVAFSPDGRLLVSGSDDTTVRIWQVQEGLLLRVLRGHANHVYSVAFSPDGTLVASGSCATGSSECDQGEIRVWRAADGVLLHRLTRHAGLVNTLDFAPDGTWLASGARDSNVMLWNVAEGTLAYTLTLHTKSVNAVAFSREGARLLSASADNTVRVWQMNAPSFVSTVKTHTNAVYAGAFAPDGTTLATGSGDGTLQLWHTAEEDGAYHTWIGFDDGLQDMAMAPADSIIFTTMHEDPAVYVRNIESGIVEQRLAEHTAAVRALAYSPERKLLASGSEDATIGLWQLEDGQLRFIRKVSAHTDQVLSVAFSPDGQYLVSGSCSAIDKAANWTCIAGELYVWEVSDDAALTRVQTLAGHNNWINSLAFSPDGTYLASGACGDLRGGWNCVRGDVRVWQIAEGTLLHTFSEPAGEVRGVAFSPDGTLVAAGAADNTLRVWWTLTGTLRYTLTGHTSDVSSVAFSPDGKLLASGSWDDTVRLWRVADGAELRVLEGHTSDVEQVRFSADGTRLFSTSEDGTLTVWQVAPVTPLSRREQDGMPMLYIPPSTFEMGLTADELETIFAFCNTMQSDCERTWFEDAQPIHSVTLDGFWMDQTEVTNGQYQECVTHGPCIASNEANNSNLNGDTYPVVGISWHDAVTYCHWVGAQLPTEAQWAYAAQGPERPLYVWGNEFACFRGNFDDETMGGTLDLGPQECDGYLYTAPVGSFPQGSSWVGALDMAGNAWEWTADRYTTYTAEPQINPQGPAEGYARVIRGGSWINGFKFVHAAARGRGDPTERFDFVGFRCVIVPSPN